MMRVIVTCTTFHSYLPLLLTVQKLWDVRHIDVAHVSIDHIAMCKGI